MCAIGENLLSVCDLISGPLERLIHAGTLVRPPPLPWPPMSILHPYASVERSPVAMFPVPEPRRRSVGHVLIPSQVPARLVQGCKRPCNDLTKAKFVTEPLAQRITRGAILIRS